jgi:hypothetical protein
VQLLCWDTVFLGIFFFLFLLGAFFCEKIFGCSFLGCFLFGVPNQARLGLDGVLPVMLRGAKAE